MEPDDHRTRGAPIERHLSAELFALLVDRMRTAQTSEELRAIATEVEAMPEAIETAVLLRSIEAMIERKLSA